MSKREILTDCRDLMAQWDFEKNELDPARLTAGSKKMAWWICGKGHSWKAVIKNRINGANCPYCAGRQAFAGFNDLQTRNPVLAKEWDYSKNKLTPLQITCGSTQKVWWIYARGHSWKATVNSRTQGNGCPVCTGKKMLAGFNDLQTLNPELAAEWAYELNKLLPTQVTPGSNKKVWWICDKGHFWKAVICNRSAGSSCPYCTGYTPLAGFNDLQTLRPEIAKEWDTERNILMPTQVTLMSEKKVWWIYCKGHSWETAVLTRSLGRGCPYCAGRQILEGFNDLQTLNPDLSMQWDAEKNTLTPLQVMPGSKKFVWWKCDRGHSWKAQICSRSKGYGCPYCAGQRVFEGFNDLQTLNPRLAKEWDQVKNELMPFQVTVGSTKMVWWKCAKGHSWKAQISSRNSGRGCPICAGHLVITGINDLQTLKPELLREWDYEKNVLTPSQVAAWSNKSAWWKCDKGHSWKTMVNSRSRGRRCPYCTGRKVLAGFNDLNTLNPQLSNEWDYEKNTLTPSQVSIASKKSVWWKCCKGHSWKAVIGNRSVGGTGCPYCLGIVTYVPKCVSS